MVHYEIQGKIAVITGATKDEVDVTIPDTIEGKPVSKIEFSAFQEMPKLKRVVFPKTIKVVGSYAFASCPKLTEVVLNDGLETIEDWAFISCGISKITLPKSIKSIGENAFLGNFCKPDVDAFMKAKDTHNVRGKSNNHSAVLPLSLMDARTSINNEIIQSRSRYVESQIDAVDAGLMEANELDIPFLFDGDEFMVAVFSKKEHKELKFEVSSDSKTQMGVYSEADPDFLVLKINIMSDVNIVSSFQIKVPYLEALEISNNGMETYSEGGINYYFVRCSIKEAAYGTGNFDREFAINLFNHLDGKFRTELKNNLITEAQYQEVKDAIDARVISTTEGFLSQIDGAPKWTWLVQMKRHLEDDPDFNHAEIEAYVFEHEIKYYNELHDVYSLMDICFNFDEHIQAIMKITGKTIEELNQKYDISITDAAGVDITEEEAASYTQIFIDLETNYNLHADFLNYIYKEMQKMQNEFSIMAFQA